MNKTIKKIIASALCITAFAGVLTGCGSNKSADGVKTYTVFIGDSTEEPSADNKILARMRDELGCEFEFEYLAGNLDEKLGVMIAGGEYPDLVMGDAKLIQAEALIPLDEYITEEDYPNLYEFLEPVKKRAAYDDGHVYILPNYGVYRGEKRDGGYYGPAFWVQKRVLADAGYPKITTLDELFKIIEDYVAKNPTTDGMPTIGYEILTAPGREYVMTSPSGYLSGSPNDGGVIVDQTTYEAKIYANSENTKKYISMVRELNEKGLVDAETFTQSLDQYLAKIASGRVVAFFDQRWNFQTAENTLHSQGMDDRQYAPVVPVLEEGIEPWYRDDSVVNAQCGFGISTSCEDPEGLLKFLDSIMTEEWQKYLQWGEEGVDYTVDENGMYYRTEVQREEQDSNDWKAANKINAFYGLLPKIEGEYSDGNGSSGGYNPDEFYNGLSDYDKEFFSNYGVKTWTDFLNPRRENPPYYPAWQIDLVDGSDAQFANQKLTDLAVSYMPKMIMAGSEADFESLWKQYTDEISKVNVKAYEDRINEQIQWRLENWQ
ncbi:MAG: extracellular solute-binding protein [Candidatus Ornithomonoglobus sp.]